MKEPEAPSKGLATKGRGAAVASTLVAVVLLGGMATSAYLRHQRRERLVGGSSVGAPPPLTDEQAEQGRRLAKELQRKEREAAEERAERARRSAELQAKRAREERRPQEARAELERLEAAYVPLRGAVKETLERALTAFGRERVRGGASAPWSVPALVGAEAEYEVVCFPWEPNPPPPGAAPARSRVSFRFTDALTSTQRADALLVGAEKTLRAALERLQDAERANRLRVTDTVVPDGRLPGLCFFLGSPGETHEALLAEEGASVTVPAGTFTGRHVRARHEGAEYELWFGDELGLPWRVLLPEQRGVRPTIELARFVAR